MTAVGEVRAEPFIARTKKTNRRDERSQARCLERSLGHYLSHGAISFIEQAFCDYRRAGIYFRIVLLILLIVDISLVTYNSEQANTVRGRRFERRYSLDTRIDLQSGFLERANNVCATREQNKHVKVNLKCFTWY